MADSNRDLGARPKHHPDQIEVIEAKADFDEENASSTESSVSSRYQIREETDPTLPRAKPKKKQFKFNMRESSLANVWSGLSGLYAMFLVTLYLAFSFTELVTFPHLNDYLEINGFFIFLYVISDLFLIYVLLMTLKGKSKIGNSDGPKVAENHKVRLIVWKTDQKDALKATLLCRAMEVWP